MRRELARQVTVYGLLPGTVTVVTLAIAGYGYDPEVGPAITLVLSLHLTAPATLMLARTARGRNIDYAEGAYNAGTTDGTDMAAVIETGTGGIPGWKRRAFFYTASTVALSVATIVVLLAV